MTSIFRVLKPGFQASIQDNGRYGLLQYGVAVSGVMDEVSSRWGNALLGNNTDAACIEIPLGKFSLVAEQACKIVVTGANLNFTVNDKPFPRFKIISIKQYDELKWSQAVLNYDQKPSGVRAYLSIQGGIKLAENLAETTDLFGSESTNSRENIGRYLQLNDLLVSQNLKNTQLKLTSIPQSTINQNLPTEVIRFIWSNQFADFSAQARKSFCQQEFTISTDFDRTGCRLLAENPIKTPYQNMVSEGMLAGSIQILPNGNPIVMMKDHPTMGGYPKIGCVFSLDLAKIAQKMPSQTIQFKAISIEKAHQIRLKFNQFFTE